MFSFTLLFSVIVYQAIWKDFLIHTFSKVYEKY